MHAYMRQNVLALGFSILAVGLTGCQMGPSALKVSNTHYSDAVRIATSEQLLVNLVRLRYRDMPIFLGVSSISTQFEFNSSGSVDGDIVENVGVNSVSRQLALDSSSGVSGSIGKNVGGLGSHTPNSLGLGAGVSYSEKPTITFSALGGEAFQKRMLAPLKVAVIAVLGESGWRGDRLLRMTVEGLNGLDNAPRASGPTPSHSPSIRDFQEAVGLLRKLSETHLISIGYETRTEAISSQIPTSQVDGDAIVDAAKSGAEFKTASEGKAMVLTKEKRVLVLRIHPQSNESPNVSRLRQLLHLKPGQTRYDFVALEDSQLDPLKPSQLLGELAVDTRSLMGILYYLSNGVEPPREHERAGLVTVTLDENGVPYSWSEVLAGLFRVQSSAWPPRNAAVAVRHRGYWFYIAADDETSKSTFLLLAQLFSLQAGDVEEQKPVLTLPVGG